MERNSIVSSSSITATNTLYMPTVSKNHIDGFDNKAVVIYGKCKEKWLQNDTYQSILVANGDHRARMWHHVSTVKRIFGRRGVRFTAVFMRGLHNRSRC